MYNRIFEYSILGLWLLAAIVIYVQNDFFQEGNVVISRSLEAHEEEIGIKRITILNPNLFQLVLKDGLSKNILGRLECNVSPNCVFQLRELFKKARDPKVVLVHKQGDEVWLLKINFLLDGENTSLEGWLNSNNLVER